MNEEKKDLSERKKLILKAIIDAHIENGEPVGSKFLTQNKQIAYSSATIRNEMAELEEMGFLEQPHTSAGRIPSELGYRFYVDSLVDRYNLTQNELAELKRLVLNKQTELDTILQNAMRLAAKLTNYTAMALRPRMLRITVDRYELMRLDEYTLVLIMVIGQTIQTRHVRSQIPVPAEVGMQLAKVLNECAAEKTAEEITMPLLMHMERQMGEYEFLVSPVIKSICETITGYDGGEIRFEGINRLLSYPEYYDMDRLKEMLALFERKEDLVKILSEEAGQIGPGSEQVQIFIGRENLVKIMDNSTLVFKTIKRQGTPVGAIGIIGPTRMDYKRVIAMIDTLTSGVTNVLDDGTPPAFTNDQDPVTGKE
ncbi:MAG: heat-inducible transcription repressor HrcA [Clostridia bacterium]|nr:heat-inducible transcription repressor HrcA [Clostridia bacterium]